MKVLHVLWELKFSGAEIMYVNAAPLFHSFGCKLGVVNAAKDLGEFSPSFEEAGFQVYHMPFAKGFFSKFSYYFKLAKLIRTENYDVVHIHTSQLKWGASFAAWIAGAKSIYTFHSIFPTHIYSYPYHLFLRWSAKNIHGCKFQSISDSVYEHELSLYKNKTVLINNWYCSPLFHPASDEEKIKMRGLLSIPEDGYVLISVGRCDDNKRHSDIIRAFAEVRKTIPNSYYVHVGSGDKEVEEKELAKQLGVYSFIRFVGNQKEVFKYLHVADVYAMTSKYEGISLTTMEAMASGIPAVLYDVVGLRDFNRKDNTAFVIPEDYHSLAETIIKINTDSHSIDQMRNRALKYVHDNYSMEVNVKKIYDLYCK